MKKQLATLYIVSVFAITGLVPLQFSTPQVDAQSAKAKQTCEARVEKLRKRGLTMNKKSPALKARYKKANDGWKQRIVKNLVIANRYADEPKLAAQVQAHKQAVAEFQTSVKLYNAVKKEYITERNAQLTSYKKFRANCNTKEGIAATTLKMRAWKTDSKTLADKAKAVTETYKAKVRPSISKIGETRNVLIKSRKELTAANVATVAAAQLRVAPTETETGSEVDDLLLQEGLDADDAALNAN